MKTETERVRAHTVDQVLGLLRTKLADFDAQMLSVFAAVGASPADRKMVCNLAVTFDRFLCDSRNEIFKALDLTPPRVRLRQIEWK